MARRATITPCNGCMLLSGRLVTGNEMMCTRYGEDWCKRPEDAFDVVEGPQQPKGSLSA
jgi:hypothetical protein